MGGGFVQSIFSPPSRRPPFECFPNVSRRDADLKILCTIPGSGLSRIVVGEALFSMIPERNTRHSPDDAALRDAGLYGDPTKPFLQ